MWFSKGLQLTTLPFSYDREMKKVVDNGGAFDALLTDLSKAFDCIPHDLIIAKLEAYGFQIDALRLSDALWLSVKQKAKGIIERNF